MATDEDLLLASLEGDTNAFGALVERHESAVCAVSFAVTGDRGVSEDVAQDAFLAAWTSLPTLREPSRFKAWACGIARNLAQRARAARGRIVAASAEPVDPAPGAEQLLDAHDREAAVWAALERLSPTYREPLVLYYREGRSTREVAQALALSVSTVEQRLSRGRKQLRGEVMDMVEQTLEEKPQRGRICAAVVAAIEVDGLPVGGPASASTPPPPAASKTTVKTIIIASAAAAALGLTVYAARSTNSQGTAAESSDGIRPSSAHAPEGDATHISAKTGDVDSRAVSSADRTDAEPGVAAAGNLGIAAAFEVTRLAPAHVVMAVRGGASTLTAGPSKNEPMPVVGHIEGQVLGPNGRPLAEAVVLGGASISMSFGTAIGSQAGVYTDARGHFALPVYQASELALVAAHHEGGMSKVIVSSTDEEDVTLRLSPFTWLEGTVREGDGGIPARVMLLGDDAPPVRFGGPTHDDGTFRLGPVPPGQYRAAASTFLMRDPGNITHFRETSVDLREGSVEHDFVAYEGAMLVFESQLPEELDIKWIRLGVFTGQRAIASPTEYEALTKSVSKDDYDGLLRGGIDAHDGDATFQGFEPGTYTGCLVVTPYEGASTFACETVELGDAEVQVLALDPMADHESVE